VQQGSLLCSCDFRVQVLFMKRISSSSVCEGLLLQAWRLQVDYRSERPPKEVGLVLQNKEEASAAFSLILDGRRANL